METEFNLESYFRQHGQLLECSFNFDLPGKDQEVMCFAYADHYVKLYKNKDGKPIAMAVFADSLYMNVRYYGAAPESPVLALVVIACVVMLPKTAGLPEDAGRLF